MQPVQGNSSKVVIGCLPPGGNNQIIFTRCGVSKWAAAAEGDVTNLTADLAATEKSANKGVANGYAGLDATSKFGGLLAGDTGEKTANKNIANGYAGLNASNQISSAVVPIFYGDGACGNVTIASCTTLSRCVYYSCLTVNITKTLNTAGNIIRVSGTLHNLGTITDTTNMAAGGAACSGAPTAGATKNGYGAGSGGGGGALGGHGNGAGGGGAGGAGGKGGKGGGIVVVYAKIINNAGSINANATNGCNGVMGGNSGNPGGGGGGGGGGSAGQGGSLRLVYNGVAGCGVGTATANSGTPGTGAGGGNGAGTAGCNTAGAAGIMGGGTGGGAGGSGTVGSTTCQMKGATGTCVGGGGGGGGGWGGGGGGAFHAGGTGGNGSTPTRILQVIDMV